MPALNFFEEHVRPIIQGAKTTTIRPLRKTPIRVGAPLYLYVGQRTNDCRKIAEAPCVRVDTLTVTPFHVDLNGHVLKKDTLEGLAQVDAFKPWADLQAFLEERYGLPFEGRVIHWEAWWLQHEDPVMWFDSDRLRKVCRRMGVLDDWEFEDWGDRINSIQARDRRRTARRFEWPEAKHHNRAIAR